MGPRPKLQCVLSSLTAPNPDFSSADVYCRVFCDSKSAEAHCHILLEIDNVVHEDTGSYIKWRHIDSQSLAQRVGRLGNGTDLDVGQVKGKCAALARHSLIGQAMDFTTSLYAICDTATNTICMSRNAS